jgi:hypothetical protein
VHDFEYEPAAGRRSNGRAKKPEPSRDDRNMAFASKVGNKAIQRLVEGASPSRRGAKAMPESVQRRIEQSRGGGNSIDAPARSRTERALDHDFSDVRVHHDAASDDLSRSLQAKAFTTGNDIFFKSGAYDPNSGAGQELLTHELTHVFQQRAAGTDTGESRISDPNEASEVQAHKVADAVTRGDTASLGHLDAIAPAGIARAAEEEGAEEQGQDAGGAPAPAGEQETAPEETEG